MIEIIETPVASRALDRLLDRRAYLGLLSALAEHPNAGARIRGGGGPRKIRWSRTGEGKRGGIRVIYQVSGDRIYVLYAYAKNETRDLTRAQIKELRRLLES